MSIDPKKLRDRGERIKPPANKQTSQPWSRDNRKGGGSGIGFGVVRSIGSDPNAETVSVTPAVENPGSGDRMKLLDNKTMTMKTWPGLKAKHYGAFVWQGGPSAETQYLPVLRIGSDFYVMQYLRWSILDPAPTVAFSDCTPVGRV